jgi:hypothetical protein
MKKARTLSERFWSKVDIRSERDVCWEWKAGKTKFGYGQISGMMAHRVSWMLSNCRLEIPVGMYVCHSCDNPGCVRPDHLWLGSQSANMTDCRLKGRWRRGGASGGDNPSRKNPERLVRGTAHRSAKLNEEKVRDMRRRYSMGVSIASMAREYGVSEPSVDAVVKMRSWKHVK